MSTSNLLLLKKCQKCDNLLEDFERRICDQCRHKTRIKAQSTWRQKNSARPNYESHKWQRKARYGVTQEVFIFMLEQQDNRCALCEREFSPGPNRPCVDHDHKTKKVRSLLCMRCNIGLGNLGDDLELLEKAVKYLRKHR